MAKASSGQTTYWRSGDILLSALFMIGGVMSDKSDNCLVCDSASANLEQLPFASCSRYYPWFFRRVAICRDCGHIQLSPLFSSEEYSKINARFFGAIYLREGAENVDNNQPKLEKLQERLSPFIRQGMRVLEIGPGEAWAQGFFADAGCEYFAIEPVKKFREHIIAKRGVVIGADYNGDYRQHAGEFDLIVMRHVLEHLLNPRTALRVLKQMLAPKGLFYIAVPNCSSEGSAAIHAQRRGFRTSYIRPVHISYFVEPNLIRLAQSVGLAPAKAESTLEIFCLFRHGDDDTTAVRFGNYYETQKATVLALAERSSSNDMRRIVKDLPKALIRRLIDALPAA